MLHLNRIQRQLALRIPPRSLVRSLSKTTTHRTTSSIPAISTIGEENGWLKYGALMVLASAGLYSVTDNCGIVGVVGKRNDANSFLLEGLTILQNRGYDSAGMATQKAESDGVAKIAVTKFASVQGTADSINLLRASKDLHNGNTVGIAHTRWATHGKKKNTFLYSKSSSRN